MRKIAILIMLVLVASTSFAQKMPDWVTHKPTPTNDTYLYVVESATAETELSARNQAFARLFQSTAMRLGQPINSEEINKAVQRGTDFNVISAYYKIPINKVCEYIENKSVEYRAFVLCQVAKAGNIPVQFDDFSDCYEGVNKYYAEEALYADGFSIYKNKRKLEDSEIRAIFANSKSGDLYDIGMGYSGEYIGLSVTGVVLIVASVIPLLSFDVDFALFGAGCVLVGSVCLITKSVLHAYGKKQIRKAVRLYNNGKMYAQNSLELEYGFTGTGFGLTLHF